MAYEVTATRRRPKTFEELSGQEFVAATLKNSLETGHIAHAYLFSGPRGCGKTSTARILARSLNCEKGPTASPCGVCSNCIEIARGANLDVIEIDGASNTSVNDIRQIKDEVLFPPNHAKYKVYIIDEVHMLSPSAFNALLKTIEEPPPYIVFIFATTEMHKVPATIKSRCQQFSFRLIPLETIAAILKTTCAEMGIEAEDEALAWIAKESTGSMRDAYTLFDQVAAFSNAHITTTLIREKLGLVGLEMLNSIGDICSGGDLAAAFTKVDEILANGVAIEQFVIDLAEYMHNLLFIKAGITRESILGFNPSRFSAAALNAFNTAQLEHGLDLLLTLYRDIKVCVSPRFELELCIAKLCGLNQWVSPQDLRTAIDAVRGALVGITPAPRPAFAAPANTQAAPPQLNNTGLAKGFDQYMAQKRNAAEVPEAGGSAPQIPSPPSQTRSDTSIHIPTAPQTVEAPIPAAPVANPTNQIHNDAASTPLHTPVPASQTAVPPPAKVKKKSIPPHVQRVLELFPGEIVEYKETKTR